MITLNNNRIRLLLIPFYLFLAYVAFVFVEQRFVVTSNDLYALKPAVIIFIAAAGAQLLNYFISVIRGR